MRYLEYELYEKLYARYMDSERSGPENLFNERFLERYIGTQALDLCGGNGRMSIYLTKVGLDVTYIEGDTRMTPLDRLIANNVRRIGNLSVEEYLETQVGSEFCVVVCQQAINYWLNEKTTRLVSKCLQPGGSFVFNTFNQCPSEIPTTKIYQYDGFTFTECSYLIGSRVHHVQAREGLPMHLTDFEWISPEQFWEWLTPHFDTVTETRRGATSIWTAVK